MIYVISFVIIVILFLASSFSPKNETYYVDKEGNEYTVNIIGEAVYDYKNK